MNIDTIKKTELTYTEISDIDELILLHIEGLQHDLTSDLNSNPSSTQMWIDRYEMIREKLWAILKNKK